MKRFGLEGCETFIPGLKVACDTLVERGVEKIFIGMPHRGRMNVLANVVRKPLEQIFAEFQLKQPLRNQEDDWSNSGDVKYHLGTSYRRTYPDGKKLMITVLANPSHLEAVDPVVMGRARAEQHFMHD
jgi:2-oxoglutarate dehydrogenase E1 component